MHYLKRAQIATHCMRLVLTECDRCGEASQAMKDNAVGSPTAPVTGCI